MLSNQNLHMSIYSGWIFIRTLTHRAHNDKGNKNVSQLLNDEIPRLCCIDIIHKIYIGSFKNVVPGHSGLAEFLKLLFLLSLQV